MRVGLISTRLTASYLGDALGDLLVATSVLAGADSTVRVSWVEEPGEFRWVLDRIDDHLLVRIIWFDGPRPSSNSDGEVVLDARCSVGALQHAIAAGARAVLDEWGHDGYRDRWARHDFPTSTLRELERHTHAAGCTNNGRTDL